MSAVADDIAPRPRPSPDPIMDDLRAFCFQEAVRNAEQSTRNRVFYRAYVMWSRANQRPYLPCRKFVRRLMALGARTTYDDDGQFAWEGVALRSPPPPARPRYPDYSLGKHFQKWFAERVIARPGHFLLGVAACRDYCQWAGGIAPPASSKLLTPWIASQGVARRRDANGRHGFFGIGFSSPAEGAAMTEHEIIDRFVDERCRFDGQTVSLSVELYDAFRAWTQEQRLYTPSIRLFVSSILARAECGRWRHPRTRRAGVFGIGLRMKRIAGAAVEAANQAERAL